MRRIPRQVAALPARRGGLALPTAMAAIVCGSSVLAVAATGTVALGGGERVAVEITSPHPSGPASAADGAAGDERVAVPEVAVRTSNASGIPAVGALRRPTGPGTTVGAVRAPVTVTVPMRPVARTAGEYPVAAPEAGRPDQPFRPLVRDGAVPDRAAPAQPRKQRRKVATKNRTARAQHGHRRRHHHHHCHHRRHHRCRRAR